MPLPGIPKSVSYPQALAVFHVEHATNRYKLLACSIHMAGCQGGITCGAIDEPRKSSKAIDKRVIIDFRDENVAIARFRDINEVFI